MPAMSKPMLACVVALLAVARAADELSTFPWVPCSAFPGWLCGDLYFCAQNQTSWQYWGVAPWPVAVAPDPLGANGFLYGYRTNLDTACTPGKAPLIRMKPGLRYRLTLHNTADRQIPTPEMLDQMLAIPVDNIWIPPSNTTFYPRHETNLHLHGSHVSGQGDFDNVFNLLDPGNCRTFKYIIQPNNPGSSQWYHPHFHGKVSFQVIGGAFGMLNVDDAPGNLRTSAGKDVSASTLSFFTDPAIERNLAAYNMLSLYMGNGNPFGAQLSLTQNQWHRLRVLTCRPEGLLADTVFQAVGATQCLIYEIAWDGVYASQIPYMATGGALPKRFRVHGAQRTDYAIRCNTTGAVQVLYNGGFVAQFNVAAGTPTAATPFLRGAPWTPLKPNFHADLRDGSPAWTAINGRVEKHTMRVDLVPGQMGISWDNGPYVLMNPDANSPPTATMQFGPGFIYQITYLNTIVHPMHLHQQHYQVVQPGGCGPALKEGEFYDTISSEAPSFDGDCAVRFRFIDYAGPTVLHCHVLDHEDTGIVGYFNVPVVAPAFESTAAFTNVERQGNCCVPRVDAAGKVICQGIGECGNATGFDTCNQVCTAPFRSCPTGRVCTTANKCVRLSRSATEEICSAQEAGAQNGGSSHNSTSEVPIYPWVVMGVSIAVAVVSVVAACCVVRRNRKFVMMEEVSTTNLPFGRNPSPAPTPVIASFQ